MLAGCSLLAARRWREAHSRGRLCHRFPCGQRAMIYAAYSIPFQHAFEQVALFGLDEAEVQPAEDVVGDRLGEADLAVAAPAARLEAGVRELLAEHSQWHAVLQRQGDGSGKGVHESGDRGAFLGHFDEDLARLPVGIETYSDVALVSGDGELMRERGALFRQAVAHCLRRRILVLNFWNQLLAAGY